MQRRTFLKAAASFAGLALAPAFGSFQQKRQIDLSPFCDADSHPRYDLTTPFAQGDNVIATDGRILVRTTLADIPQLDDERKLPNINALPFWNSEPKKWLPWPKRAYGGTSGQYGYDCPYCQGIGGFGNVRKCIPCDGTHYVSISTTDNWNDYELPCKECKNGWLFDVVCDECNGCGTSKSHCYQQIGDLVIASIFDAKLRQLGDLEFALIRGFTGDKIPEIVQFRGEEVSGFLMPMEVSPGEVSHA